MNTPVFAARVKNVEADEVCHYCVNTGWVVAQIRKDAIVRYYRNRGGRRVSVACAVLAEESEHAGMADFEEMGPCPMCQQGFFEEFGDKENQTKTDPVTPPWLTKHRDSFWGPFPYVEVVPLYESREAMRPLSLEENRRRWRAMGVSLGLAAKDMPGPDDDVRPVGSNAQGDSRASEDDPSAAAA